MKTILLLVVSLFSAMVSYAQVANDDCANAIPILCGETLSGSTTLAAVNAIPDCGSATVTSPGVWYSIIGTGDAMTVSLCDATTYDSKLGVYEGTCGALVCVAGNDDAAGCLGLSSELSFNSTLSTVYYIYVHGYATNVGDFDITVTCAAPCAPVPANDLCAGALPLTIYPATTDCNPLIGTNECSSTNLVNPACFLFGNVQDVWYSINSGDLTSVNLTLNNITGSNFRYALYTACGTVDVNCGLISGTTTVGGLTTNTDYLIQIFNGGGPDFGTFDLCAAADTAALIPVANDDCSGVILLIEELACSYTAASVYAATETIPADSCNNFLSLGALDVWFSFICTNANTTVEVDPMFDPVLQIRDACGGGNILGCSDNVGATDDEFVNITDLTVGNTYYIRVYPFGVPANPSFNICVYEGDFVSVNEVEEFLFNVFPNPTNGVLNINYDASLTGTVNVLNSQGQLAKKQLLNNSIDLNDLEEGLYFVNIVDENGNTIFTERIVLNK